MLEGSCNKMTACVDLMPNTSKIFIASHIAFLDLIIWALHNESLDQVSPALQRFMWNVWACKHIACITLPRKCFSTSLPSSLHLQNSLQKTLRDTGRMSTSCESLPVCPRDKMMTSTVGGLTQRVWDKGGEMRKTIRKGVFCSTLLTVVRNTHHFFLHVVRIKPILSELIKGTLIVPPMPVWHCAMLVFLISSSCKCTLLLAMATGQSVYC